MDNTNNLMEQLLKRLEEENIPFFSMTEKQLARCNEILKELVELFCVEKN